VLIRASRQYPSFMSLDISAPTSLSSFHRLRSGLAFHSLMRGMGLEGTRLFFFGDGQRIKLAVGVTLTACVGHAGSAGLAGRRRPPVDQLKVKTRLGGTD